MTIEIDMTEFNSSVINYVANLGQAAGMVVRRQAGALASTLIRISPPTDVRLTKQRIKDRVSQRFVKMNNSDRKFRRGGKGGKHGRGDIRWYSWQSDALYGVQKQNDMRDASVEDLRQLLHTMNVKGTKTLGQRGKQRVVVWQKQLVRKATVNKLIRRIQDHVGRLKAGWVVSWQGFGSPGRQPQAYVMKHLAGARGSFIDNTRSTQQPNATITNSSVGADKLKGKIVQNALKIRIEAMRKDVEWAIKNPEKWRERESNREVD